MVSGNFVPRVSGSKRTKAPATKETPLKSIKGKGLLYIAWKNIKISMSLNNGLI